ncbi:hypothetical protein Tco_1528333 [Tanacetum coccineum]
MTCSNFQQSGHNKTSCDKDPVPKPPRVNRAPVLKPPYYATYAFARGGGRGSRGGRGEGSGGQRGGDRGQRGGGRGQSSGGKGQIVGGRGQSGGGRDSASKSSERTLLLQVPDHE